MSGGADLATLAVAIDSSGAKTGADQAVASAERIKSATTSLHQTLGQTSSVLQSQIAAHERLTKELAKTEAATQGVASSTQQAIDPFKKLQQEMAARVEAVAAHADRLDAATAATTRLTPATTTAADAFTRLRAPLQTATVALSGLPGPAGRVVAMLGQLAAGGALMIGVAGGAALLGSVYRNLTEDARRRREEHDKLIQSLEKEREAAKLTAAVYVGAAATQMADAERRLARVQTTLEALDRVQRLTRLAANPLGTTGGAALGGAHLLLLEKEKKLLAEIASAQANRVTALQRVAREAESAQSKEIGHLSALAQMGVLREERMERLLELQRTLTRELLAGQVAELGGLSVERELELRQELLKITGALTHGDKERRSQLAALVDAEMTAAQKLATFRQQHALAEKLGLERQVTAIERQIAAAERLTAGERERLRGAELMQVAMDRQVAAMERALAVAEKLKSANPQLDRFTRLHGWEARERTVSDAGRLVGGPGASFDPRGVLAQAEATQAALDRAFSALGVFQEGAESYRESLLRQVDAQFEARRGILDLAESLGILPQSVNRVLEELARLDALKQQRALSPTLADIGNADFKGGLTPGDFLGLAGAAMGLVQGIIQSRRQAELEAARFRAATADWERSLSRFAASIDGQSPLQQRLQALEDQFLQFAEQAASRHKVLIAGDPLNFTGDAIAGRLAALDAIVDKVAGTPMEEKIRRQIGFFEDLAKALGLYEKALTATNQAYADELAERRYAFGVELEARLKAAEGMHAEAEAIRLLERQRQEYLQAQTDAIDAVGLATLRHVHALEEEEAARQQSIAAAEKARQTGSTMRDLVAREMELGGNSHGASQFRLADQAIKEFERVQDLFRDGFIDEDALRRFNALIEGEMNAGLGLLEQQLREAAEAIERFNQASMEDLDVRRLMAMGLSEEAAVRRLALDQERERLSFLAQGADAATLAFLDLVHQLEQLDAETTRLNAAERERVRLLDEEREMQERLAKATADRLSAERRMQQDLDVRYLEALGQADAADDLRRQVRFGREIEDALTAGRSPALIELLKQIQAMERDKDLADRERRLAEALEPDPVARRNGFTTSFDGRSITSAQADTMAAYLATIAINTSQLVRLAGGQPQANPRSATSPGGAPLGGASLNITIQPVAGETPGQALDRTLAAQGRIASTAAGTPPGV